MQINHPLPVGTWIKSKYFAHLCRIEAVYENEYRYGVIYADGLRTHSYVPYGDLQHVYDPPYPMHTTVCAVGYAGEWIVAQLYVEGAWPGGQRVIYRIWREPGYVLHVQAEELYLPCRYRHFP
jgi:hypothetical protein